MKKNVKYRMVKKLKKGTSGVYVRDGNGGLIQKASPVQDAIMDNHLKPSSMVASDMRRASLIGRKKQSGVHTSKKRVKGSSKIN